MDKQICLCWCWEEIKYYLGRTRRYVRWHNRRNIVLSEGTKQKISIWRKWIGHSEDTKIKISQHHRGIKWISNPCYWVFGKNHPKYKEPELRIQKTNKMIRWLKETKNGITYCVDCHKKEHSKMHDSMIVVF